MSEKEGREHRFYLDGGIVFTGRIPEQDAIGGTYLLAHIYSHISNRVSAFDRKGRIPGRPQDAVGIAGAINGLAPDFCNYLAIGALGILVADGALNHRTEKDPGSLLRTVPDQKNHALLRLPVSTTSLSKVRLTTPIAGRLRSSPAASMQASDCLSDHPAVMPRHRLGAILFFVGVVGKAARCCVAQYMFNARDL